MSKLTPLLLSVIKSKSFKAIVGIVAAALAAYASQGCGAQPARSPALVMFQCRVAALAPYVADAAPQVVSAIADSENPIQFLLSLGLQPEDIINVVRAYEACSADAGAPLDAAAPADASYERS